MSSSVQPRNWWGWWTWPARRQPLWSIDRLCCGALPPRSRDVCESIGVSALQLDVDGRAVFHGEQGYLFPRQQPEMERGMAKGAAVANDELEACSGARIVRKLPAAAAQMCCHSLTCLG